MDLCKLLQGVSSSLPSSLFVSSSNRAADGHTRDRAGKRWEMLFHWQLVPRRVCICFCLLPMKYYGSECAIKELEPSAVKSENILQELQGHWENSLLLSLWNGTPGQLCSRTDPSSLSLREGWLLGRSFAGTAESFSLTGASWWAFPSAVLLQLISDPAESPSASHCRVIPSDTSHCTDQTAFQPASWGNNNT